MDGATHMETPSPVIAEMFEKQKRAYLVEGYPSAEIRLDRLKRAKALLLENKEQFVELISLDFGKRSEATTLFADIVAGNNALVDALKHVKSWMKPQKRSLQFPIGLLGAKAQIMYQPKGVVGLVTPWNFPLNMIFVPLAQMLAAGNRVMVKPSELTPRTSAFLSEVCSKYFDQTELAFITGGVETSQQFVAQKWDHLMFTGSPTVGRQVMRAASSNLTPLTLELGGKSPVIVSKTSDLDAAAERIATMKLMNAGQICLAPDYALVDQSVCAEFIPLLTNKMQQMFGDLLKENEATCIISERHKKRLEGYIREARSSGAIIHSVNHEVKSLATEDKYLNIMSPIVVENAAIDTALMREEIFGPILPIIKYDAFEEAIAFVNSRERPLSLYYFGQSRSEKEAIVQKTTSGGVTINDILWHGAQDSLPLGGVGNSGFGRYHGIDGFLEFSHHKPIMQLSSFSLSRLLGVVPPYGKRLQQIINLQLKR